MFEALPPRLAPLGEDPRDVLVHGGDRHREQLGDRPLRKPAALRLGATLDREIAIGGEVFYAGWVNLVDELHLVAAALAAAGVPYAVCGGVAVTVHGAVRSTKDLDLLVLPDDVARVLEVVRPLGYAFVALPMTFEAGTARARNVQRVTKIDGGEHLLLDLLLAEGPLAGMLDDRVEVQLPRGALSVVSLATLVRMKRLAGRAQDLADLERLEGGESR
jgi:hypothetical protein